MAIATRTATISVPPNDHVRGSGTGRGAAGTGGVRGVAWLAMRGTLGARP